MNIWKHNHLTFISWESHNLFNPRPCWRRLVLAWERLTRWEQFKNPSRIYSSWVFFRSKSTKPLLHKHSPARRLWTSPWRSSTHVEVLLHWAFPTANLQYYFEHYLLQQFSGAVALGHPLAASGSRISAHLVHKLRRNGEKYGIGSACIGGGQGIAILFERVWNYAS